MSLVFVGGAVGVGACMLVGRVLIHPMIRVRCHHREGFSRFLVQSPLVCHPPAPPPPSPSPSSVDGGDAEAEAADFQAPYGSYHQLYRLDGRLIAVCMSCMLCLAMACHCLAWMLAAALRRWRHGMHAPVRLTYHHHSINTQ